MSKSISRLRAKIGNLNVAIKNILKIPRRKSITMNKDEIERGKTAELLFIAMEIEKGNLPIKVNKDFEIKYDIDFVLLVGGLREDKIQFNEKDIVYCEVKQDSWINETENIVIELCMDRCKNEKKEREIGWTRKTQADFIYYYNMYASKFTVICCKPLKEYMMKILINNDMDSKTLGDYDNLTLAEIDCLKFGEKVRHDGVKETQVYNKDGSTEGTKYNYYYGADSTERDYYNVKKGEINISSLIRQIQLEYPDVKPGRSLFKQSVIKSVTELFNKHYGNVKSDDGFTLIPEEDFNRIRRGRGKDGIWTFAKAETLL